MNTYIYYGFNVLILAAIVLIVGLIKPKWILIWMDEPPRLGVAFIAALLFMGGMTLYGEGNKQLMVEKIKAESAPANTSAPSAEVPAAAATPAPAAASATGAVSAPVTAPAAESKPATP